MVETGVAVVVVREVGLGPQTLDAWPEEDVEQIHVACYDFGVAVGSVGVAEDNTAAEVVGTVESLAFEAYKESGEQPAVVDWPAFVEYRAADRLLPEVGMGYMLAGAAQAGVVLQEEAVGSPAEAAVFAASADSRSHSSRTKLTVPGLDEVQQVVQLELLQAIAGCMRRHQLEPAQQMLPQPSTQSNLVVLVAPEGDQEAEEVDEACKREPQRKDFCSWIEFSRACNK